MHIYIYMYAYVYACIYTYIYIYIYMYTDVCAHMHIRPCTSYMIIHIVLSTGGAEDGGGARDLEIHITTEKH